MDCSLVRISETKCGITSVLNFDIAGVNWLKESILKIFSDRRVGTRFELNKSLIVLYDANLFGGFIRIVEKGGDSLFIPEGRNGHGINFFLKGITRAIMLMNATTSRKVATEEDSSEVLLITTGSKSDLDLLPFNEDYAHSCETTISISGVLLQADIEHLDSFDQSLGMVSFDDVHSIKRKHESDEFANLKDFFQDALTNGVNSLSQFLLHEFQRVLASSLGNLTLTPTNEGDTNQTGVLESGDDIRSRHAHSGWDFPDLTTPLACEGFYDIPDFTSLGDEFIGHVSENEKRVPISTEEDLWDSDTNDVI
ncbi:unnamed protein product [Cuscuta epithymum]|uniref:Uncharacterized protein n=1 Tax=Cuscuta epithymum TaxID=186058 RepID=A0AAV0EQD7_9ASTE|nr:unnamed protein product [Cuscuta epithymum]